jgi:hypothetical protein
MEIKFELENSDIVADFEPDFRLPNLCDTEKVQWKFSHGKNSHTVADVFDKPPDARLPTERILSDL